MAGVLKITYKYTDKRVKFKILKHFKKCWYSAFPWEIFLTQHLNATTTFYTSNINNVNTISLTTLPNMQLECQLLLKINLNALYTYIDSTYYTTSYSKTYLSTYSCLYTATRINFYTTNDIAINTMWPSVSYIFPSSQWVERELREFFNLCFYNLNDTRRLLTDYTTFAEDSNCYKLRSYNELTQELYHE